MSSPAPPGGSVDCLKISRINRLARFLRTAFPSFFDATSPSRVSPDDLATTRTVRNRPLPRWAASNTRLNSPRFLSRRLLSSRREDAFERAVTMLGNAAWTGYDEETVRRFRPLARRRLITCRPFFVLMRTRNPWVRARRWRFGWKVRFMASFGPCSGQKWPEKPKYYRTAGRSVNERRGEERLALSPSKSCVTVASPANRRVGSPPEVFHNCGKKCGKAQIFASPNRLPRALTGLFSRRRLKWRPFFGVERVSHRKRAVTTGYLEGESPPASG
jgi:hypothetical protein